jgi:hypothetical protein
LTFARILLLPDVLSAIIWGIVEFLRFLQKHEEDEDPPGAAQRSSIFVAVLFNTKIAVVFKAAQRSSIFAAVVFNTETAVVFNTKKTIQR